LAVPLEQSRFHEDEGYGGETPSGLWPAKLGQHASRFTKPVSPQGEPV
jgi:hypothetical protein